MKGNHQQTVIVRGLAESFQVTCLIDTGSQATLVNLSLIRDLKLDQSIRKTNFSLSSFTKDKISTVGEITLNLTIAGTRAPHTCIVVSEEMECHILLGMDFLSPNNISIFAGTNKITSPQGSSPFLPPPQPISNRTKVRATHTTTVPPNTVMFINGTLDREPSAPQVPLQSGFLEPYDNLTANHNLLAAAALTYSERGELPIRIINPTDEPVVVYKRKLLGFMNPTETNKRFCGVRICRIGRSEEDHSTPTLTPQVTGWTKEKLFKKLRLDETDIPASDLQRLKDIVWERRECFSLHEFDVGACNVYEAQINLKPDARPQYVPPIPIPYKRRDAMEQHLKGMEDAGIIEETKENIFWNSRVFLVPKGKVTDNTTPDQGAKFRFVADFRALNSQCLPDQYQLPNINHVVDRIGGSKWYSTFDLSKSFYQVKYDDQSRLLTAFTANNKRYIFNRMVMGHLTSSSQFARMMDRLLNNIPLDQLCYFLDDLCLASNSIKSHLDRLELILNKLLASNMRLLPKKCNLLKRQVQFIGLTISQEGIRMNEDRIKAVTEIQPPRSIKETQQVMGFLSYNRKFVKGFADLAKPIYSLIDKQSRKFQWTDECQRGFDEIKRRISEGITLTIPQVDDPHQSYTVTVDASLDGYGGELTQVQNGVQRTIAYFSKKVPQHKKQWSQSKLEFEAMVEAIEHWAIYLKGTKFHVKTDCLSLVELEKLFQKSNAAMIRRLIRLSEYQFTLEHVAGVNNEVADFLSRYIHKNRNCDQATQTDPIITTHESVTCRLINTSAQVDVQADNSHSQVVENVDTLIPANFFTPPQISPSPFIRCEPLTEADLASAISTPSCICDLQIEIDKPSADIQINAISSSPLSPSTQLPDLIDLEKIQIAQQDDIILQEVRQWLDKGERPKDIQKLRLPPDLLKYWRQFSLLTIRNNVLCRKWIKHNKISNEIEVERYLVLVPDSMVTDILELHHTSMINIHPGIQETTRQIMLQYYWPKLKEDVDLFVKSCIDCGLVKQPQKYLKAPLQHVIAHELNDVLVIDHIIPTVEGTTPRGNRYILTLTDLFSGYVVAVPCKTKESEETIRLIMHHWVLRFGYPRELLADNDPSFTSKFFNAVLAFFNIKPSHGTPYKCSSTSKVERANKRINTALRLTLTDSQLRNWDIYLPYVCFALNGLRSRHTGVSPNLLVFGRKLNTPLDLTLDGKPVVFEQKSTKHGKAWELYRTIRGIVQKARKHAALDFQYSDNSYNKTVKGPYPEEHDWCFTLVNCPSHKFSKRWKGPYKICKKLDDHLYVIELEDGKEKVVNVSKLKKYTRSKFSPPLSADAAPFCPNPPNNPSPSNTSTAEQERRPEIMEAEYQPATCQLDPAGDTHLVTQTPDDDWVLLDYPTPIDTPEISDDLPPDVIVPPNPDPAGPPTVNNRYPRRNRVTRNPMQLIWGGKSYV